MRVWDTTLGERSPTRASRASAGQVVVVMRLILCAARTFTSNDDSCTLDKQS